MPGLAGHDHEVPGEVFRVCEYGFLQKAGFIPPDYGIGLYCTKKQYDKMFRVIPVGKRNAA
jgi:phosphorylcholine metabolism protein LicD